MTERDDLREAFSKIVIEADRDWNGNVSQYRKYLVDRLTDSGLFGIAPAGEEVTVEELEALMRDHIGLGYERADSQHERIIGFDEAGREALRAGDNHNGDIEQQYSEAIDKLNRATDREINASDGGKTYRVEYDGFVGTKQGEYVTREGKAGVVLQQVGTKVVHVYNEARIVPVDYASDGKESEGGAERRSARSTKADSVRGEAGSAPSQDGSLAQLAAGIESGPSEPRGCPTPGACSCPSDQNAAFQNTDDADPSLVLAAVRHCASSWAGEARLLGNVRAKDIVRAIDAFTVGRR